MLEIERRFLCRIEDGAALRRAGPTVVIRQAYLTTDDPAVRVRQAGDAYLLTIKSGRGRVRREVEVAVGAVEAEALFEIAGDRRMEKLRHRAGRWEVDVFTGKLAGLLVAEVELDHADEPLPAPPPGVRLLEEVTDERGFTNQRLAAMEEDEARAFVERLAR